MGLLENAAEWLESQRIRELSVPIVYQRRDGETLNIPATLGRTLFRAENEYGVTIRTETRDFLIAAEDLPDDPERGDLILHAGQGEGHLPQLDGKRRTANRSGAGPEPGGSCGEFTQRKSEVHDA